jgi:hypothetical protein
LDRTKYCHYVAVICDQIEDIDWVQVELPHCFPVPLEQGLCFVQMERASFG